METQKEEVPQDRITVTIDLDSWNDEGKFNEIIERRVSERIAQSYHTTVREKIENAVAELVQAEYDSKIEGLVQERLNAPVIERAKFGGDDEEETMLDYLSRKFNAHLLKDSRRNNSDSDTFDTWIATKAIHGLDKLVEGMLKELRAEAEAAIRDKVKHLLGDYIAENWRPHPLPPLLSDDNLKDDK